MTKRKTGLKVNYGAVEKLPLKENGQPTIKNPHQSLFRRLQSENKFVSGAGIGNSIADVFGSFTQSAGNRQEELFNGRTLPDKKYFTEESLPQSGPGRMQIMDEVIIYPKNKTKDNTLLYIAAAIGIFLIIKSK